MIKRTLTLLFFILMIGCTFSTDNLAGYDYRLFNNSPVEELADAVKDGDTSEIKELIKNKKLNIDFAEPNYGNTLLMLAVQNQQYNSTRILLKLGADPNRHNKSSGKSPIICAAEIDRYPIDIAFVKLLLLYGGNPNDEEVGPRQVGNTTRLTPLIAACGESVDVYSPIEKVKLLVEAGADENHENDFHQFALTEALLFSNFDVALYLGEFYKLNC